jgi:hypothetical protein
MLILKGIPDLAKILICLNKYELIVRGYAKWLDSSIRSDAISLKVFLLNYKSVRQKLSEWKLNYVLRF